MGWFHIRTLKPFTFPYDNLNKLKEKYSSINVWPAFRINSKKKHIVFKVNDDLRNCFALFGEDDFSDIDTTNFWEDFFRIIDTKRYLEYHSEIYDRVQKGEKVVCTVDFVLNGETRYSVSYEITSDKLNYKGIEEREYKSPWA